MYTIPTRSLWFLKALQLFCGLLLLVIISFIVNQAANGQSTNLNNNNVIILLTACAVTCLGGFLFATHRYSNIVAFLSDENQALSKQLQAVEHYISIDSLPKESEINSEFKSSTIFKTIKLIQQQKYEQSSFAKQNNWRNESANKLSEVLRKHIKTQQLIEDYIQSIAKVTNATQGLIWVNQFSTSDSSQKITAAGYACADLQAFIQNNVTEDGILHQIYLDKETKIFEHAPDGFIRTSSGLGGASLNNVIFVPLVFESTVFGVLELARYVKWSDFEIQFIEDQSSRLAASLFNLQANLKTEKMLADAQSLTAELQTREVELLATNEKILNTRKALEQSQMQIQRIMANVPDVIFQLKKNTDGQHSFIFVSDRIEQAANVSAADLIENFNMLPIHNEDKESWHETLQKSEAEGTRLNWEGRLSYSTIHETCWININAIPEIADGGVVVWDGILSDVTERVMFRHKVSEMNENLEHLVKARTQELESTLEELKDTQQRMIQSEKLATMGQLVAGVAHEMNTPLAAIKAAVENMQEYLPIAMNDLPGLMLNLDNDQRMLFYQMITTSMATNEQLSTKDERSIRRTIEEQLSEYGVEDCNEIAKKLVITGIRSNIEQFIPLFHHSDASNIIQTAYHLSQMKTNMQVIENAVNKTRKTVYALKRYSHFQQGEQFEALDLKDSLEVILTTYHNQLKHGVKVVRNYQEVPQIFGLSDELGQVWTNIITNAAQAMKYTGTITVGLYKEHENAVVTISDNGPGIPQEVMSRIFEPFFTTKPQGEGTGLGLDICKKIIEKHNGTISVSSEPGNTCFTINLPISQPNS